MIFLDRKESSLKERVLKLAYFLLWFIIFAILIKIASYVKEIFFSFSMAILVNYFLSKPVDFLTRFIKVRALSLIIIFVTFLIILGVVLAYLIPVIALQLKTLETTVPEFQSNLDLLLSNIQALMNRYQIELSVFNFNREELVSHIFSMIPKLDYSGASLLLSQILSSSVFVIAYFFLTIILSFYLLIDGRRAWEMFLLLFSKRIASHLQAIKEKVDIRLNSFLLGQLQIASLTTLVMISVYFFLNVPYSLLLGLAQMIEIIPVVGTWIAIVPCILIVAFTTSFNKGFIALMIYLFYSQMIRDNFVAPRILGSSLGFHPLAILLTLLLGAQFGGLAGVVLALPLLAILTSVIDYNLELVDLRVSDTSI